MEIIEATKKHINAMKDLLVELQQYVVLIDKFHLNILSENYRDGYFRKTWKETKKNGGKIFLFHVFSSHNKVKYFLQNFLTFFQFSILFYFFLRFLPHFF